MSLRRSALLPPLLVALAPLTVVGRGPIRTCARTAATIYMFAVAYAAAKAAPRPRVEDGCMVAAALLTMHVAHGLGFWAGSLRWGFPWAAFARVAGIGADGPYKGPVDAPHLVPSARG